MADISFTQSSNKANQSPDNDFSSGNWVSDKTKGSVAEYSSKNYKLSSVGNKLVSEELVLLLIFLPMRQSLSIFSDAENSVLSIG